MAIPAGSGDWEQISARALDGAYDSATGSFRTSGGGGGGGGAVTVADGADVTQGAVADAANTTGATGTISGKLRGIVTILASVWDSVNGLLKVSQATSIQADIDSILTKPYGSIPTSISASTSILNGAGKLRGIFVTAASATPTIKVWDNTAASGTVVIETFTPTAGTLYQFMDARVTNGIYVTISGTVTCTVLYDNTPT